MKVYQNIKNRRRQIGMTQEELAKRVGYSGKSMIARIESGNIDLPLSKVEEIAKVLRIDPMVLMGWQSYRDNEADELLIEALIDASNGCTEEQIKLVINTMELFKEQNKEK